MTTPSITTVAGFLRAAQPAFQEFLTSDELAATAIHAIGGPFEAATSPWPEVGDDVLLDDDTTISVSTLGNTIGIWAGGGRETPTQAYERVRSDLQDFVAESSFGWGRLRP